ncbi:helix-turn-helix domain-containing protein [Bordetella hinzii]|uniref:helix-turn-helix domain-containing protein n=1 Tax=Bordetella hinzii TaxID=103855 RepID=UPI00163C8CF1|nr:helix-turn-helix transcriptional regulator [Bordetella hinzii]
MRAAIEQGVAWQIRVNRQARGWTQAEFAGMIGGGQSAISRLEDPEYGCHSLNKLLEVADAFDCALLVKFVPYSTLAEESEHLSPECLFAAPFADEIED